jgi:sulfide:quinone oxidoreductase
MLWNMSRNHALHRVVVVGGGFAAAEAVLALRAYAGDLVDIEIVSADAELSFRPGSTAAAFTDQPVATFSLPALARDNGATFLRDRLEAVAPDARRIRLASGAQRTYDALVLAVGARARVAVPGALTFRDQRDVPQLQSVRDAVRAGDVARLAVAVPVGGTWSLPAYELALLISAEAEQHGVATEVSLVTPERAPLEVFGTEVSEFVSGLLANRDVRFVRGAMPATVERRGLRLSDGGTVAADHVIALPGLVGRRIAGVPPDYSGFVPTGPLGRVEGLRDVYAAGDMTSFPVKQGGIAAQQADAIAAEIAGAAGATPTMRPLTYVLRTQLFGAPEPAFLEARLDACGNPIAGHSRVHPEAAWWPQTTVFGRHVTAWMADQTLAAA